jgi:hypothetical protein
VSAAALSAYDKGRIRIGRNGRRRLAGARSKQWPAHLPARRGRWSAPSRRSSRSQPVVSWSSWSIRPRLALIVPCHGSGSRNGASSWRPRTRRAGVRHGGVVRADDSNRGDLARKHSAWQNLVTGGAAGSLASTLVRWFTVEATTHPAHVAPEIAASSGPQPPIPAWPQPGSLLIRQIRAYSALSRSVMTGLARRRSRVRVPSLPL